MTDLSAEDAYLFRHAIIRDAAYQLYLPSQRARLHRLVVAIIEAWNGVTDETIAELLAEAEDLDAESTPEGEYEERPLDAYAAELADHARQAQHPDDEPEERDALARREVAYLWRAGRHAAKHHRTREAIALFNRLAAHAAAHRESASGMRPAWNATSPLCRRARS